MIAGHGRVQAARLLGLTEVPTLVLAHLSDAERRAYILADNKLAANAGWDSEILAIELQFLSEVDFDLEVTGFSIAEIDFSLSASLPVALGSWTEDFNRQWYERLSGQRVSQAGQAVCCVELGWRRCTLDGFIEDIGAVWEAKHTGAFTKSEEVLERYMPQLQHNMAVCKSERAVLSVIFGNQKYEIFEVASDWIYQIELLEAELDFWDCVATGRIPLPAPRLATPRPIGVREVCLEGNNAWAAAAADWLEYREAAKRHATACTDIKSLIEPDVARAFGHNVEAKRSKSGAISIREMGL